MFVHYKYNLKNLWRGEVEVPVPSGRDVAEKWAKRLKSSTAEISAGVDAVTENPFDKAVKQQAKLIKKWLEAIESGRWKYEMEKFTLEDYKRFMKEVGIPRIAKGVDMAVEDQKQFYEALMSHIAQGLSQIQKMPKETLEDAIERAVAMIRHMAKFKKYEKV